MIKYYICVCRVHGVGYNLTFREKKVEGGSDQKSICDCYFEVFDYFELI